MTFDVEQLQQQIPYYLTAQDQQVLLRELKAISEGRNADYFLSDQNNGFTTSRLQGDGWRGFEIFQFETGEKRALRGLILSNSCDIDTENQRDIGAKVIFAPLVKLSAYVSVLKKNGVDGDRLTSKVAAIKNQKTTNIFYLPPNGVITDEYIVRLDDVYSMPVSAHESNHNKEKLFTLSNTGFYMLIFKLSIHFCRLQERVQRQAS